MQKIEGFFGGFLSFLFVIFIEISNFINKPFWKIKPIVDKLVDLELLDKFVIKKTTI